MQLFTILSLVVYLTVFALGAPIAHKSKVNNLCESAVPTDAPLPSATATDTPLSSAMPTDAPPPGTMPPGVTPTDAPPPGTMPPGATPTDAPPPGTTPPGATPTDAPPPGTMPPGATPTDAPPSGTTPPGAKPPGAKPPGTKPTGAKPPGTTPPGTTPTDVTPSATPSSTTGTGAGSFVGQGTFYAPGLGACGETNNGNQLIAAISHDLFDSFSKGGDPNNDSVCGRKIHAEYKGKSVDVTVVDRCTACKEDDLDFSPAAFDTLADPAVGRISGMTWSFTS